MTSLGTSKACGLNSPFSVRLSSPFDHFTGDGEKTVPGDGGVGAALMKGLPGGTALPCFSSRGNVWVIKAPSLPVKFPSLPGEGAEQKQDFYFLPFPDEAETHTKPTKNKTSLTLLLGLRG